MNDRSAVSTMVLSSDVVLIIIAIIFPPAAVFLITGCGTDFLINLLLTLFLGFILGHVHAFWLIYRMMKAREQHGRGGFVYAGSGRYAARSRPYVSGSYYGPKMFYGVSK